MLSHHWHEKSLKHERGPTTNKGYSRPYHFLSYAGDKVFCFFAMLKKNERLKWTSKCKEALSNLNVFLASPPILTCPIVGSPLSLFICYWQGDELSTYSRNNQSGVTCLFRDQGLQGWLGLTSEDWKAPLGSGGDHKEAYTLFIRTSGNGEDKLSHLQGPQDTLVSWVVKLSEYDIQYIPRGSIKSQILADFLVELS